MSSPAAAMTPAVRKAVEMRRRKQVLSGSALAVLISMRPVGAEGEPFEREMRAIVGTPTELPWWVVAAAGALLVLVGVAIVIGRRSRRRDHWTELKR